MCVEDQRLIYRDPSKTGGVAQLGERLLCKQEVIGSIPFTSTSFSGEARRIKRLREQRNDETLSNKSSLPHGRAVVVDTARRVAQLGYKVAAARSECRRHSAAQRGLEDTEIFSRETE